MSRLPPERVHALLVGIDDYGAAEGSDPAGAYPPLAGCVADALQVRAFLLEHAGVPEAQVETLLSPAPPAADLGSPATYERMVAGFRSLAVRARPGDAVWIHYSGHGGRRPTAYPALKGAGAWDEALVPADIAHPEGRYLCDLELAYLFDGLVRQGLFVTLVLDCCHAGGLLRGKGPPPPGARAR